MTTERKTTKKEQHAVMLGRLVKTVTAMEMQHAIREKALLELGNAMSDTSSDKQLETAWSEHKKVGSRLTAIRRGVDQGLPIRCITRGLAHLDAKANAACRAVDATFALSMLKVVNITVSETFLWRNAPKTHTRGGRPSPCRCATEGSVSAAAL